MVTEGISQVSSMEDEDFLQHILFTSPSCPWDPNLNPTPQPQLHDLVSSPHINPYSFNDQVSYNNNNANGFGYGSQNGHSLPLDPRQEFHPPQNVGGLAGATVQAPQTNVSTGRRKKATTASTGGSSGGTNRNKSGNRARRGEATDPHSIAERLRRERIAERMKALQELVPNGNKTDKASMLDEIIDYVKFLQLQVKIVSMSRLGAGRGLGALAANMSSEGSGLRRNNIGNPTTLAENNNMRTTENQVAKLMEEDMGSAMQYLQGKGLCLMPISLASAISTGTCGSRNPLPPTRPDTGTKNNNIVNNVAIVDQPATAAVGTLVADHSGNDASNK